MKTRLKMCLCVVIGQTIAVVRHTSYIYFFFIVLQAHPQHSIKKKKSFLDANDAGQSFGLGCIK